MSRNDGEIVLLFGFEEQQLKAVQMVLYMLQITGRCVKKQAYGMPLKLLTEKEEPSCPAEADVQELDGQMIVFAGLREETLERVLALLRANPTCGKIPYKAILTQTNQEWNAYALFDELKKEHAAMHGRTGD